MIFYLIKNYDLVIDYDSNNDYFVKILLYGSLSYIILHAILF